MYCIKCGAVLRENARFCEKCGNAVNAQTSKGTPTIPAIPAVPVHSSKKPATTARPNPFAFVSAGIMGVMLLLYFLPWFFIDDQMVGMLSHYISCMPLVYPDDTAVILFLMFTFVAVVLMIFGVIVAIIRKNHIPMAFAIISSTAIQLAFIFFVFTEEAWKIGVSVVPVILYLMSYVNIAFAIPAKIR